MAMLDDRDTNIRDTNIRDLDAAAVAASLDVVAQVRDEHLDQPTPCADWDVRALLAHMTVQHHGFAAAAEGRGGDPAVWAVPSMPSTDPVTDYRHAADRVTAAFGVVDLDTDRFALHEFGVDAAFPATVAMGFHFIDYLAHAWDTSASRSASTPRPMPTCSPRPWRSPRRCRPAPPVPNRAHRSGRRSTTGPPTTTAGSGCCCSSADHRCGGPETDLYAVEVTSPPDAAALIPIGWRDQVSRLPSDGGPTGADWAVELPHLLARTLDDWGVHPVGPARTGCTALVIPVERDGTALALKLVWPHTDGAGEPLALRLWDGNGAVRLVAANPGRGALLLEWLDPTRDLEDPAVDIDTACEIIGQLLRRLHVPAPPNIRSLAVFLDEHLHGARGLTRAGDQLPRRAVDRALKLATDLLAQDDATTTLVHGDLHFRNVLAAEREPWLTIDPKPLAGHPGIELQPVLRNRVPELGTGSAFRWSVRRRLEVVCDSAGIDEDTARGWTIVISTLEAYWATLAGVPEHVGLHLALAKALDD